MQDQERINSVRIVDVYRGSSQTPQPDYVAEEVPVALVYNGISHVVMMATPEHIKEFAVGFSLTEGIVASPQDIYDLEIHPACNGLAVEITITEERFWKLKTRRRFLSGRTGCGLCGIENLQDVEVRLPVLTQQQRFDLRRLPQALVALRSVQKYGSLTGCMHAAVWLNEQGECLGGLEDVARHVALDKILGLRAIKGAKDGVVLVSSRASYEMVQKAAMCGVEILLAVSAPTARAVDAARACGLSLAAFCRNASCNIYSGPKRFLGRN